MIKPGDRVKRRYDSTSPIRTVVELTGKVAILDEPFVDGESSDVPISSIEIAEPRTVKMPFDVSGIVHRPTAATPPSINLKDVASIIESRDPRFRWKEGRSLPVGQQWVGHDIPGRGKAAARRLRQMERNKK